MALPYSHIYLFAALLFHRVVFSSFPFVRVLEEAEWVVQHRA
jgi:hypothetical protein